MLLVLKRNLHLLVRQTADVFGHRADAAPHLCAQLVDLLFVHAPHTPVRPRCLKEPVGRVQRHDGARGDVWLHRAVAAPLWTGRRLQRCMRRRVHNDRGRLHRTLLFRRGARRLRMATRSASRLLISASAARVVASSHRMLRCD
eukprot:4639455-Pleurochrysis_carterae.AAC.3